MASRDFLTVHKRPEPADIIGAEGHGLRSGGVWNLESESQEYAAQPTVSLQVAAGVLCGRTDAIGLPQMRPCPVVEVEPAPCIRGRLGDASEPDKHPVLPGEAVVLGLHRDVVAPIGLLPVEIRQLQALFHVGLEPPQQFRAQDLLAVGLHCFGGELLNIQLVVCAAIRRFVEDQRACLRLGPPSDSRQATHSDK